MLQILSMLTAISLTMINHPTGIMILVLLQTVNICLITLINIKSNWMAFILFMIFLGGLMVLFIYITSLASNEKFKNNLMTQVESLSKIFLILFLTLTVMYFSFKENPIMMKPLTSLENIFSLTSTFIITSMMTYLFLVLVVAVKVAYKFEGPLRNMIK